MSRLIQAALAAVPLLLTPLLFYALAEGVVNLGGGEKDILVTLPWLIWSIVFAGSAFVLIRRGWPIGRWTPRSALLAPSVLLGLGAIAYVVSLLGVA